MEGIYQRDFEKAITSYDASLLRGKIGYKRANKFIQDTHNALYNEHKCGYDY